MISHKCSVRMVAASKDTLLGVSLVLSLVSLGLLCAVTWYFQLSLDLLEQQAELDRELLFKLQKSIESQTFTRLHDVTRRQISDNCTCQDGMPGPRGRRGEKGARGQNGRKGQKGVEGEVGSKGENGTMGETGEKGEKGEIGMQGIKGDKGDLGAEPGAPGPMGPRGQKGSKGNRGKRGNNGAVGEKGDTGTEGLQGIQGDAGLKGEKGDNGAVGLKGSQGERGPRGDIGDRGPRGDPGSPGVQGLTGPKGENGENGENGEGGGGGGTVYVRWGHDKCPATAEIVYTGRAGGPLYIDRGGGSNPQCLPLDPSYLPSMNGTLRAHMYGAEYETIVDIKNVDDQDVPCAVCHVPRTAVHMVPAKYTCPDGWVREYYGYLMASYVQFERTQFTCVDSDFMTVSGSSQNYDGYLFYPVEGKCGSLPCPPYDNSSELSCAVCTK